MDALLELAVLDKGIDPPGWVAKFSANGITSAVGWAAKPSE
jgi:hypothetical protein